MAGMRAAIAKQNFAAFEKDFHDQRAMGDIDRL